MALIGAFSVNTPPSTPSPKKAGPKVRVQSPPGRTHSSPDDSGVDDLSLSPSPSGRRKRDTGDVEEDEAQSDESGSYTETLDNGEPDPKIMPGNPFETEHSQILFEAIDKLQSWGASKYLEIPQLLIVGGQSSGKSSLLQTLTGIPFPTDAACCTRWPTRVISKRTSAGEEDKFRVTIERPEVSVSGIPRAEEDYTSYERKGNKLTMEEFERIMIEVSDVLGIRNGSGQNDKNFATEVLKIELCGPNRSYFGILDLPGHFHNDRKVKPGDAKRVENLLIEYMKKPENIVVCVANIGTDLNHQDIPSKLISLHVANKEQTIGVFTKCDLGEKDIRMAKLAVKESYEPAAGVWPRDWFFVRNKLETDPEDFDLGGAENTLFGSAPWDRIPQDRLGSTALKSYLGSVLNFKIAECFPKLEQNLNTKLAASKSEGEKMGDHRNTLAAQTLYVVRLVQMFKDRADKSLDRPGYQEKPLEIRGQVEALKTEFAAFMRSQGAVWKFEEDELDAPYVRLNAPSKNGRPIVPRAYAGLPEVKSSTEFRQEIGEQLQKFQVSQPHGIINPDVYHKMYQLQVQKWCGIAERFLEEVQLKVQGSIMAILDEVCPASGGTKKVREELCRIIGQFFDKAHEETRKECQKHCRRETKCARLITDDIDFSEEVAKRRKLRYDEAAKSVAEKENTMAALFKSTHWSSAETMVNDVHDVAKCYYKLSLEFFIRGMTTIIEEFVASDDGPLRWLTPEMIVALPEEALAQLGSEDKFTQKRRNDLQNEISKLEGALGIVKEASRRTRSPVME